MATSFVPGAVGGESKAFLGYNAKARLWSVDRDTKVSKIRFIADLDQAEAGWMRFQEGMPPSFQLVKVADLLAGDSYPAAPPDRDKDNRLTHRKGFRLQVKLPDKLAGAGPTLRKFTVNSLAASAAVDDLLREWDGRRKDGHVAVVTCTNYAEVQSKQGSNFRPIFVISDVVPRPADMAENGVGADVSIPEIDEDAEDDFGDIEEIPWN